MSGESVRTQEELLQEVLELSSELAMMRRERDDWMGMYRVSAEREARIRRTALEARDALRGYNHKSEIAERLTKVCRGEE